MSLVDQRASQAAHGVVGWYSTDFGLDVTRDIVTEALDAADPHIRVAELLGLLQRIRTNPQVPVTALVNDRIVELSGRKSVAQ